MADIQAAIDGVTVRWLARLAGVALMAIVTLLSWSVYQAHVASVTLAGLAQRSTTYEDHLEKISDALERKADSDALNRLRFDVQGQAAELRELTEAMVQIKAQMLALRIVEQREREGIGP